MRPLERGKVGTDDAVKYGQRMGEPVECPVALLYTSPDRDGTILVKDPFMD